MRNFFMGLFVVAVVIVIIEIFFRHQHLVTTDVSSIIAAFAAGQVQS